MASNTHRQYAQRYRLGLILGLSLLGGWLAWPTGPSRQSPEPDSVACVSADGRRAATSDGRILDLADGRVLLTLPAQTAPCTISPNGAWFVRYTYQGNRAGAIGTMLLEVVAVDGTTPIRHVRAPDMPREPSWDRLIVSNDGTYVVINRDPAYYDLAVLSTQTNQITRIPTGPFLEMVFEMQFTADDRLLMLRFPRKVQALDTTTWQVAATWEDAAPGFTLAPNAPFFLTCSPTGLLVYDLQQLRAAPRKLPHCPFEGGGVRTISPDGRYLLVAENRSGGAFWTFFSKDQPNPGPAVRMALLRLSDGVVVQHFRGPRGYVGWPFFLPEGREFVTFGPGGQLHVWPVRPRPVWLQWLGWLLLTGALFPLVERGAARLRRQPNGRSE